MARVGSSPPSAKTQQERRREVEALLAIAVGAVAIPDRKSRLSADRNLPTVEASPWSTFELSFPLKESTLGLARGA